ncbi:unnamed protein product [Clavelina lepadiformis]|uniref:CULT domain-containing protein n=1 Tax=Clavelina lepadiformis TaxID=159417 RepID=A0ABP0FE96_CLALP
MESSHAVIVAIRFIYIFLSFLNNVQCHNSDEHNLDNLLCKQCGNTIASTHDIRSFSSKLAIKHWNQTLLNIPNVLVQLFENPHKMRFNVITLSNANVYMHEQVYNTDTWFPNYSWSMSVCSKCGTHLGWKYQPTNFNHITHYKNETFFGLILDKLLEEHLSDTLLLVPNSYKS